MECLVCCQERDGDTRTLSLGERTISGYFCRECLESLLAEEWITPERTPHP